MTDKSLKIKVSIQHQIAFILKDRPCRLYKHCYNQILLRCRNSEHWLSNRTVIFEIIPYFSVQTYVMGTHWNQAILSDSNGCQQYRSLKIKH